MATATAPQSNALTIVEKVEKSPAVMLLDARSQALVDLLPDAAAATRFKRVTIQALIKNPELLDCTPESVVLSVFEAAAQGLEPTGAAGGAHLVPYNVKVSKNPDRYEKRAQLIPDYRGVIRLVTKPPSEVVSLEARVVKEGDEFDYQLGTDANVHHIPSLSPDRSAKATTHVYAVARLKNGERIPDVMDRAEITRIQSRGRGSSFSPWATDWDEMGKKTVIKRISKVLPVRPEIRSILVREDELAGDIEPVGGDAAPTAPAGPTRVSRLAQRLGAMPVETPAIEDTIEGTATDLEGPAWLAQELDFAGRIRNHAVEGEDADELATPAELLPLRGAFKDWDGKVVAAGIHALFDDEEAPQDPSRLSKGQARAIAAAADSLGPEAFTAAWKAITA